MMALKRNFRVLSVLMAMQSALTSMRTVLASSSEQTPASQSEIRATNRQHFVELYISLAPESPGILENTLYEISDPSSRRYGEYLTREEAKSLLLPRQESTESVKRWLSEAGVPDNHVRDEGTSIHALVGVKHAEKLLSARLVDGHEVVTRLAQSVPASLRDHITTIHPTLVPEGSDLAKRVHTKRRVQTTELALDEGVATEEDGQVDLQQCKTKITPACLRKLYHMDDTCAKPHKKSLLGVAGFNGVCSLKLDEES